MRRTVIAARSSAGSLARAAVYQQHFQPRRMFASGTGTPPSSKSEPPTTPVDRSQDQAHPIGTYYEAVLNGSKNYPGTKPELPPVTSQKYPTKLAPAEPEARPEPEKKQQAEPEPSKPKQDDNAQGTTRQSQADPTPSSNPSGNLSGSDGSGTAPAPSSSQLSKEGEAGATKIIFSASLASAAQRAERLASIRSQSKLVAGVLVPPRPEEPDNCCMSGCVNCVWDLYRDEMEAWATATAEAEQRLAAQEAGLGEEGAVAVTGAVKAGGSQQSSTSTSSSTADGQQQQTTVKGTELAGTAHSVLDQRGSVSMDDDGGGSSSNWDFGTTSAQSPATGTGARKTSTSTSTTDTTWNDDLYKNVPVGIREFMKQEKRLKEKHAREGMIG
ncbi:oxidoreductase-like protein [Copromyces sp. CBS 386.78]|nr:oxidoreductase-like protein [Copromyces sp. CBS 386.78]